jgi:two-component system cell cycle response regulator
MVNPKRPDAEAREKHFDGEKMQDETLRILLIEDNPGDERLVREALRDFPGIQVISAYRLESGVARLAAEKVDEILLDLSLPDSQGLDSVRTVRRNGIDAAIVVLTGLDDEETAIKALQAGAQDYMAKNQLNPRLLAHTLRYAVERKRLDDRIYFQATHDDLTGLPNRALFRDRLQNALARAERMKDEARGQPLAAVLLLDLDHFKTVNDTRGHAAGDEVLRAVAQRLQETLRKGDTIARLGGDEFAILVEGFAAGGDAAAVAQKILQGLAKPIPALGEEFPIGTSIGISLFPADGEDGEALFKHADIALYRAKEQRNRYAFYDRGG